MGGEGVGGGRLAQKHQEAENGTLGSGAAMFGPHLQWDLGKQPIYAGEGAGVRVLLARDRLGLTSAPAEAEWR